MSVARPTKFFPVRCPNGHKPFLSEVGADPASHDGPLCRVCGEEAYVMPGAFFTEATRCRFELVVDAVHAARLTAAQAAAAADLLASAILDAAESNAVHVLRKVPGLYALEPMLPRRNPDLLGFIGTVVTVLDAFALQCPPMGSGVRRVARDVREPAQLPLGKTGTGL